MKLYYSNPYYSKMQHKDNKNIFLILSNQERITLQRQYVKLIKYLTMQVPVDFNNYDMEMLEFIPKMFHYNKNEDCQMLDPSITQLSKLNKMLEKVKAIPSDFVEWLDLEYEGDVSGKAEMKKIMDEKRTMKKQFEYSLQIKEKFADKFSDVLQFE